MCILGGRRRRSGPRSSATRCGWQAPVSNCSLAARFSWALAPEYQRAALERIPDDFRGYFEIKPAQTNRGGPAKVKGPAGQQPAAPVPWKSAEQLGGAS